MCSFSKIAKSGILLHPNAQQRERERERALDQMARRHRLVFAEPPTPLSPIPFLFPPIPHGVPHILHSDTFPPLRWF